jgi:uncharacterized protein YhbP (UPF0306 family)
MPITRSRRPIAEARIRSLARRLLDASHLCAIATVTDRGQAYVNTAYFAWSRELRIVWLSDPDATHSRNLAKNPSVAIAVYDSTQSWDKPDRGIQLFGAARPETGRAATALEETYASRFPDYRESDLSAFRLYEFRPRRMKLFDESELGGGTFVTARVAADGHLRWERTDVYR